MSILSPFFKYFDPKLQFWDWFLMVEKELKIADPRQQESTQLFNELSKRLKRINENITWEFTAKATPRDFVISADGIHSAFPDVISTVKLAPKVDGWRILAFRQRTPGCSINIGDIELNPKDIFFKYKEDRGFLHLEIYVKDLEVNNNLKSVIYLLLDSLLGEYDVETKIGNIEVISCSERPKDTSILSELPQVVDSVLSQE